MNLNEKIEARRRERALEAEKSKLDDIAHQQEADHKIEQEKIAEKAAIDAAVAKRFRDSGIEEYLPASTQIPQPSSSKVNDEFERQLKMAASKRITRGETINFNILLLLGLGGFFVAWWLGLVFLVWACLYITEKNKIYKEEILKEGRDNLKGKQASS